LGGRWRARGFVPGHGFAPPGVPRPARDETVPPVDQSVLGPMARTAADLMLALDVIAGPDDADAVAFHLRLPPPRATTLDRFRVLIVDEHPLVPTSDAIRAALATLATQLARAGCRVRRNPPSDLLPDMRELSTLFIELLMAFFGADMAATDYESAGRAAAASAAASAAAASAAATRRTAIAGAAAGAKGRSRAGDLASAAVRGTAMSHRDWIHADRRRFAFAAQWQRVFDEYDVVVCPAASSVAFAHDARPFDRRLLAIESGGQSTEMRYDLLPMWAAWPTPTGQPVTTIPIGRDPAGLPIGAQIIGPRLEDRTPIAFATLIEPLTGGFTPPPLE
jgi:amidase